MGRAPKRVATTANARIAAVVAVAAGAVGLTECTSNTAVPAYGGSPVNVSPPDTSDAGPSPKDASFDDAPSAAPLYGAPVLFRDAG